MIRAPAVAGAFYPGSAEELGRMIDTLAPTVAHERTPWPAIIVPHAGYQFSGRIAAAVYARVAIPDVVIVIGPRHRPIGAEWAVAPHEAWTIPGATIDADPAVARELVASIPDLELDALAHRDEHSIEVQLPLLARFAPGTRVVGIALGGGEVGRWRELGAGLARFLGARREPLLLVVSTDLNHYGDDAENRRLDALAIAAIETLDPAALHEAVRRNRISMCGLLPTLVVMDALARLGRLRTTERVAYGTSADATGDTRRVVGYVGMLLG